MQGQELIRKEYDVVVVGGGLSGLCAALASARGGATTALIQNRPVLGGNASSEIRMHICGADYHGSRPNSRETGIILELLLENRYRNTNHSFSILDTVMWEKATYQEGLDLYLNTQMTDVVAIDHTIIEIRAFQMTTEKRFAIQGKRYVDATGDGYLAYESGAEIMMGRESREVFGEQYAPDESDSCTMGNSIMFQAVDTGHPIQFKRPFWAEKFTEEKLKVRDINEITSGYWWIELGGDDLDCITDGEVIRDELLKTLYGVWDYIKNSGKFNADNYELGWVGFLPGKRESRRVVGDYILKEQDLLEGKRFEDAVAYGGWPMDMHIIGGIRSLSAEPTKYIKLDDVYTIPYRSLYSRDIDNLFLAGRAISASHMAFGSTRVMATCAVLGQAVGTAAAMSIIKGITPRGVADYIKELQQKLLRDDCYIPGVVNEDEADLARKCKGIACSSSTEDGDCWNVINGISRKVGDKSNCWISEEIGDSEQWLEIQLSDRKEIGEIHIKFDPNLTNQIMVTLSDNQKKKQIPGIPPELVRRYKLELFDGNKKVFCEEVTDNYQRFCVHKPERKVICDRARITALQTWGDPHARIFEVRLY